ncbi:MAG: T9SS type A sorting domain-containing protein [Bacteroidales bacterium]|nr:T9SS type A sorting domain-containing protein [Bacteroidales bacterium]MCF8458689.1 T9SS type A sorting domain-containing protein [Bacteroidales bacterium]
MKVTIIGFLLFFSVGLFSQSTFLQIYSDTTNNWNGDILVLESGNILMPVLSENDTSYFPVLYKFSPSGEIIQKKIFPNSSLEFSKIQQLHLCDDGNILAFADKATGVEYFHDLWVLKMDTSFNILNEYIYFTGLSPIGQFNSITDYWGNIILFCSTGLPFNLFHNFIFRFNQNGDSLNAKIYDTYNGQFAFDILQAKDNSGYYLFSDWPQISSGTGAEIVKINNQFEIINVTGHTNNTANNSALWYNESSFIVSGQKSDPFSDTVHQTGVTIVDTIGNIIKEYYWGRPDTVYQPTAFKNLGMHDSNIYYGGIFNIDIPPLPATDVTWLILNKLDSNLNPIWQKFIGGDRFYELYTIEVIGDGSCLLAGHTIDILNGDDKMAVFLAKIGPNGEFLSSPETPQSIMEVKIYPNPGSDYFMLDVHLPENSTLNLFDIGGKLCHTSTIQNGSNTINTQNLLPGMYVFKILNKGKVLLNGKWVKN